MPTTKADLAIEFLPDVLARDGLAWVSAASASMAPLIQPGDALCLAPVGGERPRVGAIVAYVRDARLVVHRVVATTPGGVVTRGDGLSEADAPLEWTRVVGRVTAIRTPAGRTLDLERPPWTLLEGVLGRVAARPARGRLAWKARRLPFHLAALLFR
jgi:hypothetical protein